MEIASMGFVVWSSVLRDRWTTTNYDGYSHAPVPFLADPFWFSLIMVTIPSMILWWSLFLLFTCKCGTVNRAEVTIAEAKKKTGLRLAGQVAGYFLTGFFCLSLAVWSFVVIKLDLTDVPCAIPYVFAGRAKAYLTYWLLFLIYFNPFVAWGTPDPDKPQTGIGDLIGVGQWRIEKQRFQVKCVYVAKQILEEKRQSEA